MSEFLIVTGAVLLANLLSSLILSTYVTISTRRHHSNQMAEYLAAQATAGEVPEESVKKMSGYA